MNPMEEVRWALSDILTSTKWKSKEIKVNSMEYTLTQTWKLGLNSGQSFEEIISQVEEGSKLEKADLLEENIETLLTAAFQDVFHDYFNLMLISRERALFQVADLIAIDPIGRLTVIEIKRDKPDSVDIVAQTSQYLVECANLSLTQIKRVFYEYYSNFTIFQTLHYACLRIRHQVETRKSLRSYLSKQLSEDEIKHLEDLKGKGKYFDEMKRKSIEYILKPMEVDMDSIIERTLKQVIGISDISNSEFKNASLDCFDKMFRRRFNSPTVIKWQQPINAYTTATLQIYKRQRLIEERKLATSHYELRPDTPGLSGTITLKVTYRNHRGITEVSRPLKVRL